MPFPLDPTFQKTGKPFITAPDGTTAPDNAGDPVDLTGVPITVAPETNAVQSGTSANITAFGANLLTLTGLHDMAAASVGRLLTLAGSNPGNRGTFPIAAVLSDSSVQVTNAAGVNPDQNSGTTATVSAFGTNFLTLTGLTGIQATDVGRFITTSGTTVPGNSGTFEIIAVLSATSVVVFDATGAFPDASSGAIHWSEDIIPSAWSEAVDPLAFPPGDPQSYLVEQVTPFNNMVTNVGHIRGGGSVILPPNVNVPPGGELGANSLPVPEGKNQPRVRTTSPLRGPVALDDPQNPVRFKPNSFFDTSTDPNSLAFGQAPIMNDGPEVQTPSISTTVPNPAVSAEKFKTKGAPLYPSSNPVVFSK